MKLLIVTFSTDKNILLSNLEISLNKYNYDYKIIGEGCKWVNFMTKIKCCYDFIGTVNNYDLIAVTDAYDVLACDDSRILIKKFLSFNSRIVVGSENACGGNCVPLGNYFKHNKKGRYNYVNGGFYIGYKDDILKMLKCILDMNISDDQIGLGKYINKFPNTVTVDTEGSLISNVNIYGSYFDTYWVNDRVKNIKTGKCPCFVHTPSIQYDFYNRMDYFGKRIVGRCYKSYNLQTKIMNFCKKYKNKLIIFSLMIFIILILIIYIILNG